MSRGKIQKTKGRKEGRSTWANSAVRLIRRLTRVVVRDGDDRARRRRASIHPSPERCDSRLEEPADPVATPVKDALGG